MMTFEDRAQLIERTEALLNHRGISIVTGSLLETAFLAVYEDFEKHKNRELIDPTEDIRPISRATSGTVVLCQRLLRADELGLLSSSFDYHLRLMASSIPSQASPYAEYDSITNVEEQNSNKLFELVVGLAAAQIGSDVALEKNKGNGNPDVLVTIDNERWGFPCKVVKSDQMRTLMDRIDEGRNQLKNSDAVRGCVVVNLKNIFPHDELNPIYEGTIADQRNGIKYKVYDNAGVDNYIANWSQTFIRKFHKENGLDERYDLYTSDNDLYGRGWIGYIEIVPLARTHDGYIMDSPVGNAFYFRFGKILHDPLRQIQRLQKALAGPNSKTLPSVSGIPSLIIKPEIY